MSIDQQQKQQDHQKSKQNTMELKIQTRSGKQICSLTLPTDATTDDLNSLFYTKTFPRYPINRQRFTFSSPQSTKPILLESGKSLKSFGIENEAVLVFKDLGPQISWKLVFLVEYFGPLLIHPLIYYFSAFPKSAVQVAILCMMIVHFGKREFETLFVHRFSHGSMPLNNLFKNSFHYWVLSGLWFALEVYNQPFASATQGGLNWWQWAMVGVFVWAELSNLSSHLILMNLRPPGTKIRRIPKGYGFDAPFNLSCPNYFFETIAWISVFSLARTPSCFVFLVAAVYQMYVWALKKHRNYKKEFPDYPKRKAMFPGFA